MTRTDRPDPTGPARPAAPRLHAGRAAGRHRDPGDPDRPPAAGDQRRRSARPGTRRPGRDQPDGRRRWRSSRRQYGDYPPQPDLSSARRATTRSPATTCVATSTEPDHAADMAVGQLAQRSVSYLRRDLAADDSQHHRADHRGHASDVLVRLQRQRARSSRRPERHPPGRRVPGLLPGRHPAVTDRTAPFGMIGFAQGSDQPVARTAARPRPRTASTPLFEFRPGRLVDRGRQRLPGLPRRPGRRHAAGRYVYFSAYEGQGYDPDDNNYSRRDGDTSTTRHDEVLDGVYGASPTSTLGPRRHEPAGHRRQPGAQPLHQRVPCPSTPAATSTRPIQAARVHQQAIVPDLLGGDRRRLRDRRAVRSRPPPGAACRSRQPPDSQATANRRRPTIRSRERDNLTNFKNGTLDDASRGCERGPARLAASGCDRQPTARGDPETIMRHATTVDAKRLEAGRRAAAPGLHPGRAAGVMVIIGIILVLILAAAAGGSARAEEKATQALIAKLETRPQRPARRAAPDQQDPTRTRRIATWPAISLALHASTATPSRRHPLEHASDPAGLGHRPDRLSQARDARRLLRPDTTTRGARSVYPLNFAATPVIRDPEREHRLVASFVRPAARASGRLVPGRNGVATISPRAMGSSAPRTRPRRASTRTSATSRRATTASTTTATAWIDELARGGRLAASHDLVARPSLQAHKHKTARSEMLYAILVEGRGRSGSSSTATTSPTRRSRTPTATACPSSSTPGASRSSSIRWPILYHSDTQRGQMITTATGAIPTPPYRTTMVEKPRAGPARPQPAAHGAGVVVGVGQ